MSSTQPGIGLTCSEWIVANKRIRPVRQIDYWPLCIQLYIRHTLKVENCVCFRFVLSYQDHLTNFCILRPLKYTQASVIAAQLVEIVTAFDVPRILQSDNGREFVACVIGELKEMWPDLIMVHGKPRHSLSQGSIEHANGDIEDMLRARLDDHKTTRWSLGLKLFEMQKRRKKMMRIEP